MDKQVYLASGFFNPQQLADLEAMKASCAAADLSYYSPKDEVVCPADAPANFAAFVLKSNEDAIRASGRVFANLRHKDLGTSFEVGLAAALGNSISYWTGGGLSNSANKQLLIEAKTANTACTALLNWASPWEIKGVTKIAEQAYVVSTVGKRVESIVAAGWLYAKACRVIYYCPGLPPGAQFNLMLAATGIAVATSEVDLAYCTAAAQLDSSWTRPYGGLIE